MGAGVAHATFVEALDLRTLVERSSDIVVATVVSQSSRWESGRRRIITDVELHRESLVDGDVGPTFSIRLLGGAVGEVGMQVTGEAQLESGATYLLFLRAVQGTHRPVGMTQGVMKVEHTVAGPVVQPGGGGLSLVRRSGGSLMPGRPALETARPLDGWLEEVRAALRASQ